MITKALSNYFRSPNEAHFNLIERLAFDNGNGGPSLDFTYTEIINLTDTLNATWNLYHNSCFYQLISHTAYHPSCDVL